MADTGVSKEVIDVLQAAARAVDVKFTFPAAVETAGHDHFAEIYRQGAVVGKEQGNLCHAQRFAGGRTSEDDIFGLGTAQVADILLPEHPTDGIGDVALAAAVRADDSGYPLVKIYGYLICKGLKSISLQAF